MAERGFRKRLYQLSVPVVARTERFFRRGEHIDAVIQTCEGRIIEILNEAHRADQRDIRICRPENLFDIVADGKIESLNPRQLRQTLSLQTFIDIHRACDFDSVLMHVLYHRNSCISEAHHDRLYLFIHF